LTASRDARARDGGFISASSWGAAAGKRVTLQNAGGRAQHAEFNSTQEHFLGGIIIVTCELCPHCFLRQFLARGGRRA